MTLQAAMKKVLELSQADGCIVIGQDRSSVNLRWANNTMTTNGSTRDQELYIISIIEKKVSVEGWSYFPENELERLVRQSEAACQHKEPAEDYTPLMEKRMLPDWSKQPGSTGPEVFQSVVGGLSEIFSQANSNDLLTFGYAEHDLTTTYLATSTGLFRRHQQSVGQIELNLKSADFKRSVWTGQASRDFSDVEIGKLYRNLEQRLEWSKTRIELPPGHYETLLQPSAVADLLIYAYWSGAARDADEGRSAYSLPEGKSRIGQKICSDLISLYSDPKEPGFEVDPFAVVIESSSHESVFDNGFKLNKTFWINNGRLENLITPRYWAARQKRHATPFIQNLILPSPNGPELNEMIAQTKKGLLVTCLWYIREVDPQTLLLTGLTRDGVFLIENGQVRGAVNNFRFNMSPIDVLAQSIQIGRSESTLAREFGDYFKFAKMPPLRVKDFNMSSVSQAT